MNQDELRRLVQGRHAARRVALQALYQWQMTGDSPKDILTQFREERPLKGADLDYFRELTLGVPERVAELDAAVEPFLDRALALVDPVERAVLRLATYELIERLDVPYRVVLNEAVDLAKVFGAEQGHRFVNGVLDKAVRRLREAEIAAAAR
ncbi:transcription antitermination factor NusB [Acidihalobacter ferrooxydans]|uniref:Transcription antitermination protein NusB n=1 Tax=Acidihalobacter ferrooxydans TaxID=1765967 RepID=A0A1P8UKB1_9GAMM|nr:transcription antitermination factor NusB [Acidihalobacter ferrooxydans]APZ44192.1 N utilization substance protein B [Acidihalobacter ferrooxydans]